MKQEYSEAQLQLAAALRNFWPVVYPEISTIAYGPLMISAMNKHLVDWNCQFKFENDAWQDGDFAFDSDEDRVLFILKWGGSQ